MSVKCHTWKYKPQVWKEIRELLAQLEEQYLLSSLAENTVQDNNAANKQADK